ncbi:CAIB/BAIF family enzyme [Aspergillus costaricaensis CBS 115574]|uniref:CAIB/BAIF family enzyme n=1 Tax=Aspergillus costaricaensis CBS 115574 TaxID=1448317 RepID=A0ACD1ISC7_9EURO|nr:CAIB/BAIF family enzyme [Aspergillus costaricaensis CBS 115574]RAK92666.1 CAIB/BAIF family enzyme [Aspergillus costaricaensis CBS 115574]
MSFKDRSTFTARDTITYLWQGLHLPPDTLDSLCISEPPNPGFPSSFKIGHIAQASIALSALLASQIHSLRNNITPPKVTVPYDHACIEFNSARLYTLNGQPPSSDWGLIGGLYRSSDGYVRVHDSFPNHREGTKSLLGCSPTATRDDVASKISAWRSVDLETTAVDAKLAITALRSYEQWDVLPQAKAIADFPILLRKIGDAPPSLPARIGPHADKCLRGLRVLELSRVIAAPLCGKTLAAHGADVLWVTSPHLPDLPGLDREFGRGKRTVQFDLQDEQDTEEFFGLLDDTDVFIQGYRPGSLAARGLSPESIMSRRPNSGIIYANMSAYGPNGPWSARRGFDSLVQTCSGMNVSEAEHFGAGEAARPLPCQALDHAGGFFLASGIMAALYKQATEGGSWQVDVSLAGVMKYLRSLGQYEEKTGFQESPDYTRPQNVPTEYFETRSTGFGEMTAIRHAANIEGVEIGCEVMPKPLGSDEKRWLEPLQ